MSKYESYSKDQLEEHFSNFLIDSWSYSKVSCFARNEKDFERRYIYREPSRKSATTIAGSAYHGALAAYFENLRAGIETSLPELERIAFEYIDSRPAYEWKLMKTTPTMESAIKKATDTAVSALANFMKEKEVYSLSSVHGVELPTEQWLSINGVDIPLPCHAEIDLVGDTEDGRTVVIDHKLVGKYTDDEEVKITRGKQAVTYAASYEALTGVVVDEVWFVENKASANKDGSPQLRVFRMQMDPDSRRLYEAMLYEPLRRMCEAVSDPDYVYTMNDSDNLADRAELYTFWCKTLLAEADDFDIPDGKKELIKQRQRKIRDSSLAMLSPRIIKTFGRNAAAFIQYDLSFTNMDNSEKIEHILRSFGMVTKVEHVIDGYSSDTYLLEAAAGVKIGNITKYRLDLASALNVASVRIGKDLVVYDGKSYLSIEAGKKRTKDLLWDTSYLQGRRIPVGVDNYGNTIVWDLDNNSTPHMLVCGATGSGKSVCIRSTIEYAREAGITDIVVMDPKYEFTGLASEGVRVVNDISDIEGAMKSMVKDMQSRAVNGTKRFTLVIFDEFADAVQSARSGRQLDIREDVLVGFYSSGLPKTKNIVTGREKSLEENLKMLLQKGRSLGFRILAATQRASTEIITGDAKVNFPVQVCFRVPKALDSKVVLDEEGAESLQGHGDGLMRSPEYMDIVRFQGFYYKGNEAL